MNEKENKPWIAHGSEWAEHEDYLIGNREGFLKLRDAIDKVVESGTVTLEESRVEFMGLKVVEKDPRIVHETPKRNGIGATVAIFILLGILGLLLLGVMKLVELMR